MAETLVTIKKRSSVSSFKPEPVAKEIVDQIAKDAKPVDNNGTVPKEEQPVITSIKVID